MDKTASNGSAIYIDSYVTHLGRVLSLFYLYYYVCTCCVIKMLSHSLHGLAVSLLLIFRSIGLRVLPTRPCLISLRTFELFTSHIADLYMSASPSISYAIHGDADDAA
jgi:hypothetical protein